MSPPPPNRDLADVGLLNDDARRRVYDFATDQARPVTREQAAAGTGMSRALVAYHLDRLAEGGLLDVDFARTNGRSGPGSGRPAKRYTRSRRELAVSFPPRNYSLLAEILAAAADNSPSDSFRRALAEAATDQGGTLGQRAETISAALTAAGYEPARTQDGDIVLRNCPFHSVVAQHTELVCTLNRAFIQGALHGAGEDPDRAVLSPCEGRCCVVIHAAHDGPEHSDEHDAPGPA